jgi:hypothetical protein
MNFRNSNMPRLYQLSDGKHVPKQVVNILEAAYKRGSSGAQLNGLYHTSWARSCVIEGYQEASRVAKCSVGVVVQAFVSGDVQKAVKEGAGVSANEILEAFVNGINRHAGFLTHTNKPNLMTEGKTREELEKKTHWWLMTEREFRLWYSEDIIRRRFGEMQKVEINNFYTGEPWDTIEMRKLLSDPFETMMLFNHLVVGILTPEILGIEAHKVNGAYKHWCRENGSKRENRKVA